MTAILVSLLNNLGDVVMATAALRLLKEKHPGARIDVLVRPEAAEVLRHNPDIENVIVYAYKSKKTFYKLRETVDSIRENRYDVFLSLDRRLRSALIAFLARIPRRLGPPILFRHGSKQPVWTRVLFTRVIPLKPVECAVIVEMFNMVVRRAFDISGARDVRALPVLPECAAKADGILASADGPVIGLCVYAKADLKNWAPERFAELITRLKQDYGAFLYITGAPSERGYADAILEKCPAGAAVNLAGETSLMDTVALAAKSALFITLDTGAVHVVARSGVPRMICLFCCTCPDNLLHALPSGTSILWTGEKCSPCSLRPEECSARPCVTGITVDMVYDEVRRLLGESTRR